MKFKDRRQQLRALLSGDGCVYPASVYDPISARLAEQIGFEAGMLAGSIASQAILGDPDIILLTLTELADQARRIGRASGLPILVDADHGYGNAINVIRTVEELETAGVAGLTIEDTWLPAPFGTSGKAKLIPIEEGVGKMRAALHARVDPGLVIVGRTSALQMVGLDETLERISAYEAAGVDAIFLAGVRSADDLVAINAAIKLPIILGPAAADVAADRALLAAHRVRLCLQGHLPFAAAIKGAHDTLLALRSGTLPADVQGAAPDAVMRDATAAARYAAYARDFLGV
jgi:carboxyvinyl-carboxyphosphonate phosphorylmutase